MKYDVVVIGSGPGGYVAAIRCSQLGMKTAIVEKYSTLGGTCLNVGCIPTKTLLESSAQYYNAKKNFKKHGIEIQGLSLDFSGMIKRKDTVISQNCKGIQQLLKKNNIDTFFGTVGFKDANTINIAKDDGSNESLEAGSFIIATGSKPFSLPGIDIDKKRIITSTEALSLKELPESIIIIGAGVIGLELGSVYVRLGVKVNVLEIAESVVPTMDLGLSKELQRLLKKAGLKFSLGCEVKSAVNDGNKVVVTAIDSKGKEIILEADYCLTAIGRKPYTSNLWLEKVGIVTTEKGEIPVNEKLQTAVINIYAVGDVIRGPMLAHKASEEGAFAAEVIAGLDPHLNYKAIPSAVYTSPEAASVGYTEEELVDRGIKYKSGSCPIRAMGRAHAADKLDGIVKVLADEVSGVILGVHMLAPWASDMIAEAVVALELNIDVKKLGSFCYAHPSFSEALKEACLMAAEGKAIHV